ncbi:MAG TPA: alpha/beta hydrolase [Acidimicrobiales bacterium]
MDPAFASLPDRRRLAYDEYGDPDGIPVLNCHGGLTSRKDMERCAATAAAAGVRVISPDRPGIGRSDAKPGRTLLDWPPDVAALADALGSSVSAWWGGRRAARMRRRAPSHCRPGSPGPLSWQAAFLATGPA